MPNKDKKDKNKKTPGKGGSKSASPAKSNTPKHEDFPQNITEQKEVGIGMPVGDQELEVLKEKAKKVDR